MMFQGDIWRNQNWDCRYVTTQTLSQLQLLNTTRHKIQNNLENVGKKAK